MKLGGGQINARLDRPSDDIRLYLFHGPDEAGAQALADRLARALGPDIERIDLDPAALRSRPGTLADEAASMSLFGERRYIRVLGAGEESVAACAQLLEAEQAGNPAVVIAPSVRTSSKLVKLAIAASNAISFACYVPEGEAASRIASGMARDQGVRLTGDTAERMWDASGGDRAVLAREIEKLALYLDAAPDRPREADGATLEAIGADMEVAELHGAIAAIIDGNPAEAGDELEALREAGVSSIPLLRQLGRKLVSLAGMRSEVEAGSAIDPVIERHRVFFKEKAATTRALRKWNSAQLAHALDRVHATERLLLSTGNAGEVLAQQLGVAMARAAERSTARR